ncbi:C2 domain-containing protein 5 isoform X1 [Schistocerca piceifrons]|uniref:C2 domain-containing protein 5 isoform X1 n=2 Tax=Schistocerca piceifrons TaxID=274613 RepID=UPI001F5EA625|nr:C2 domain-containing protein 5 isoform X1 [Schistocerca piceifrons]XP_047101854.1 C2 domain-containing protein 5 isoform X1 [Schistocerca piceifrons]
MTGTRNTVERSDPHSSDCNPDLSDWFGIVHRKMPGKVKVKILAGRNLPVMDRSSDTTDAYVEIKLGNTTYKTDVYRKSLNPQWNSDWYKYEVDDSELQDEPLQIRLMDHDTYSANDAIGKVYLDLNPLLLPSPPPIKNTAVSEGVPSGTNVTGGATMAGWIPVFDTMHGIRGEVNIIVKVELFSDFNKFRQSSCGVQFFCSPVIPHGYHAQVIHGFVEELVVNDDPEYQWIDKIRTPRASNEARQTLFFKLSGEVQRKIGLKALDLGGNAVIGYHQCFDLEGESGIVVRGIGTAVTLTRINDVLQPSTTLEPAVTDDMFSSKPNAIGSSVAVEGSRNLISSLHLLRPESGLGACSLGSHRKYRNTGRRTVYPKTSIEFLRRFELRMNEPKFHVKVIPSYLSTDYKTENSRILCSRKRPQYSRHLSYTYDKTDNSDVSQGLNMFRKSTQSLSVGHCGDSMKQLINKMQIPHKEQTTSNNRFIRAVKLLPFFHNVKWKSTLSALKGKLHHDVYSSKRQFHFKLHKYSVFPNRLSSISNVEAKQTAVNVSNLLPYYATGETPVHSTLESSFHQLDSVTEVTEGSGSSVTYPTCDRNVDESINDTANDSDLTLISASSYLRLPRPDDGPELQYVDGHLMSNIRDLSSSSSSASSSTDDDVSEFSYKDEEKIPVTTSLFQMKNFQINVARPNADTDIEQEVGIFVCNNESTFEFSGEAASVLHGNASVRVILQEDNKEDYKNNTAYTGDTCKPKLATGNNGTTRSDVNSGTDCLRKIKESDEHRQKYYYAPQPAMSNFEISIDKRAFLAVKDVNDPASSMEKTSDCACELTAAPCKKYRTVMVVTDHTNRLPLHSDKHSVRNIPLVAVTDTSLKETMLEKHCSENCVYIRNRRNSWPVTRKTSVRYHMNIKTRSVPDIVSFHCYIGNTSLLHSTKHADCLFAANRLCVPAVCTAPVKHCSQMIDSYFSHKPHYFNLSPDALENRRSTLLASNRLEKTVSVPVVAAADDPDIDLLYNISPVHKTRSASSVCSLSVTHGTNFVGSPLEDLKHHVIKHGPCLVPISRHVAADDAAQVERTVEVPLSLPSGNKISPSPAKIPAGPSGICRRSSDSDLSITPKGNSLTGSDRSSNMGCHFRSLRPTVNQDNMEMLEYPFLTMRKYGPGFIQHLGGTISARSVKLLERITNLDEPESRDSWWTELRMEVRSHARAIGCNVVLGYSEHTSICDDVCVLSASGTAAFIQMDSGESSTQHPISRHHLQTKELMTTSLDRTDFEKDKPVSSVPLSTLPKMQCVLESSDGDNVPACSICHIPYSESSVPFRVTMMKCVVCGRGKVPDVLLTTIEPPEGLPTMGKGCFLQAYVCRPKRVLRGELNAKEISDGLPFLEYELHRLLLIKLKLAGMNSIFGLKVEVAIGEKMMIALATGTAIFLSPLPVPPIPKISCANPWTDEKRLNEIQKSIVETVKKNRDLYQLKNLAEPDTYSNGKVPTFDTEDSDDERPALELSTGNKDTWIFEIDDSEDVDKLSLLIDPRPPEGFHTVNIETVPGLDELEVVRNLQMFTQVWRAKISSHQTHVGAFSQHINRLLQSVYFKLRRLVPCALCNLEFRVELPEIDEVQLSVLGMAIGLSEPEKMTKIRKKIPTPTSKDDFKKLDEGDMIFNLEEDHDIHVVPAPAVLTNNHPSRSTISSAPFYKLSNVQNTGDDDDDPKDKMVLGRERYGVDITPLSYIPGAKIERYLGNLNFFFIRESTSIREAGGLSGFVHSFVTEVLAILRAHVTALGGNAMVAYFMSECVLYHNPHKNQGQCLINVGGDVVCATYYTEE